MPGILAGCPRRGAKMPVISDTTASPSRKLGDYDYTVSHFLASLLILAQAFSFARGDKESSLPN